MADFNPYCVDAIEENNDMYQTLKTPSKQQRVRVGYIGDYQ